MPVKIVVLGYAYGQPASLWSNQKISEVCSDIAEEDKKKGVVVITQSDIIPRDGVTTVYVPDKTPGVPPTTVEIAEHGAHYVKEHPSVKVARVVAARSPHLRRALRDTRKEFARAGVNKNVLIVPIKGRTGMYPLKKWYSKDSIQIWTTRLTFGRLYELLLLSFPYKVYRKATARGH